jgi:hypothetical protein
VSDYRARYGPGIEAAAALRAKVTRSEG